MQLRKNRPIQSNSATYESFFWFLCIEYVVYIVFLGNISYNAAITQGDSLYEVDRKHTNYCNMGNRNVVVDVKCIIQARNIYYITEMFL